MGRSLLHLALATAALAALASGCGARQPITTWYYSAWYPKSGAGNKGGFEQARDACLAQGGMASDPAAVAVDSDQESSFVDCMNAAGWCTNAFQCDKPGA